MGAHLLPVAEVLREAAVYVLAQTAQVHDAIQPGVGRPTESLSRVVDEVS
jgi:hypothetical protein